MNWNYDIRTLDFKKMRNFYRNFENWIVALILLTNILDPTKPSFGHTVNPLLVWQLSSTYFHSAQLSLIQLNSILLCFIELLIFTQVYSVYLSSAEHFSCKYNDAFCERKIEINF